MPKPFWPSGAGAADEGLKPELGEPISCGPEVKMLSANGNLSDSS